MSEIAVALPRTHTKVGAKFKAVIEGTLPKFQEAIDNHREKHNGYEEWQLRVHLFCLHNEPDFNDAFGEPDQDDPSTYNIMIACPEFMIVFKLEPLNKSLPATGCIVAPAA